MSQDIRKEMLPAVPNIRVVYVNSLYHKCLCDSIRENWRKERDASMIHEIVEILDTAKALGLFELHDELKEDLLTKFKCSDD